MKKITVSMLVVLLIGVCTLVLATHWPALSAKTVWFDDYQYLTDNTLVQNPGWTSARQFLAEVLEPSTVRGYYQPLSMISLMADYALGGRTDNLMPFHRTSLVLHIMNTALVIVLLYLLFGRVWIAAGVGLLFGLHPMTVESIPWVSERKTLLAVFFALWCLILYVHYTRKSHWWLYAGCMVLYVLALMSKPTSTPLPLLMLLMDFWPLVRFKRRAVLEKLPFFVVGGIFAVITYVSQSRTADVVLPGEYDPAHIPLILCHNIIFYLYKIIWPAKLSPFYAFPEPFGLSDPMVLAGVIGTCILIPLLLISLRWTRVLLTSWLFFFVGILPTIGIVGFTIVIAADRFAYLPSIGLLMVLASLLAWFCRAGKPMARRVTVVTIILILAGAESVATRRYLAHWRDTISCCNHVLMLTPNVAQIHCNLGIALASQNKFDEAIVHYRKALQMKPNAFQAHYNLANALQTQGKIEEAINHHHQALQLKPNYAEAHNNLGIILAERGRLEEAINHYRKSLQIKPNYAEAHNNLGNVLGKQRRLEEAISHFRQALQIKSDYADAHSNLGNAFALQSNLNEAIKHWRQALKIDPNLVEAHYNIGNVFRIQGNLEKAVYHWKMALQLKPDWLGLLNNLTWVLATSQDTKVRNPTDAVKFAQRACELTDYKQLSLLDTLAVAYAAAGRFSEAIATAEKALGLAQFSKQTELTEQIRNRLHLYEAGQPYTEP